MIALIAAVANNNIIGSKNDLPWYLPEDLKRFRQLTLGKVAVMGRKTFESIIARLGKPLPNRTSAVISSQKALSLPKGAELYHNLADALAAHKNQDIFIIGGAQVFKQSIELADTLYITRIHKEYEGDAYFPEIDETVWRLAEEEKQQDFSFLVYKKR